MQRWWPVSIISPFIQGVMYLWHLQNFEFLDISPMSSFYSIDNAQPPFALSNFCSPSHLPVWTWYVWYMYIKIKIEVHKHNWPPLSASGDSIPDKARVQLHQHQQGGEEEAQQPPLVQHSEAVASLGSCSAPSDNCLNQYPLAEVNNESSLQ